MASVKVFVDVTQDILEDVVKPFKARHQFSKLVVKLLEAYNESDSIKEYIDNSLLVDQDVIEQSLYEELSKMKASFERLDSITGDIKDKAEKGMDYFSESVSEKETEEQGVSEKIVRDIVQDEINSLKAYLEDLILKGVRTDVEDAEYEAVEFIDSSGSFILEEYGSVGGSGA